MVANTPPSLWRMEAGHVGTTTHSMTGFLKLDYSCIQTEIKNKAKTMSAVLRRNSLDLEEIVAFDRATALHPFTDLHAYAHGAVESTVVETGKGSRIRDAAGREFLDGFAGLYCVNIGYGRTEVAEAIS